MLDDRQSLGQLRDCLPRAGRVHWIGVRPAHREPMAALAEGQARAGEGLDGDRYTKDGKRQVTLIQAEHLPVIGRLAGWEEDLEPALLRRNLVIGGISLLALKEGRFRVGEAVLEGTGPCHPCARMEEVLGEGGYNAVRGHGGITARVVVAGRIRRGDRVIPD